MEIKNWQLAHFDEWDSTGLYKDGTCGWTDVVVPHNVQQSCFQNTEELFFSDRIRSLSWTEEKVWVYRTEIGIHFRQGKRYLLEFNGLDYFCTVYINGKVVLEHEGMFSRVELDVTDSIGEGYNFILVAFQLKEDMRSYDLRHHTLKCQNSYKWDAAPRMLTMGIWDNVRLYEKNPVHIKEVFVKSSLLPDGSARIGITTLLSGSLPGSRLQLSFGDVEYVHEVQAGNEQYSEFVIEQPVLWYPAGYGQQYLYDVRWKLVDADGTVLDERCIKHGIRTIQMVHCPGQDTSCQPLQLVINGNRVFIRGSNIVPLDVFPAALDEGRYDGFLKRVADCNINLLRVWGGGLVEKESFYSLCDRYGILVWQEFPLACANPPEDEGFLSTLEKEAASIIKKVRNHCSVVLLCGGNELYVDWSLLKKDSEQARQFVEEIRHLVAPFDDDTYFAGASRYDEPALKLLERLCSELDGTRPFHMSSPLEGEGEVHGPWGYDLRKGDQRYRLEDRAFHDFWNNWRAHLYSEAGCSAVTNPAAYKKIICREEQWPIRYDSADLNFHNAFGAAWNNREQWLDPETTEAYFGPLDNLEDFVWANQYIQAEGLRYIVEECRRKKPSAAGVITWALNETWPNAASLSILDYHLEPKMAYWYVRNSFSSVIATLRYTDIVVDGSRTCELWADADNIPAGEQYSVGWEIYNEKMEATSQGFLERITLEPGEARHLENIQMDMVSNRLLFVQLTVSGKDGACFRNLYAFGSRTEKYPLKELLQHRAHVDERMEGSLLC